MPLEPEVERWILGNPSTVTPTEILLPLSVKVGPVWTEGSGGSWYAALVIDLPLEIEDLWHCDHHHAEPGEARHCGHDAARELAEEVLNGRDPSIPERMAEYRANG